MVRLLMDVTTSVFRDIADKIPPIKYPNLWQMAEQVITFHSLNNSDVLVIMDRDESHLVLKSSLTT